MRKTLISLICLLIGLSVAYGAPAKKTAKKIEAPKMFEVPKPEIIIEEIKIVPSVPVSETKVEVPAFIRKLSVNGALRIRYTMNESPAAMDAFSLSRARIKITGEITPDILFLIQPDFAGLSTGGTVALADAYAQLKTSYATFKAGQFLLPFAYDSGKYKTIYGTGLNPSYYNVIVNARDYGVRATGALPNVAGVSLDGALVNGTGGAETNKTKDIVGRVSYKNDSLDVGLSGYYGKAGAASIEKKDAAIDLEYKFAPYQFVAESLLGQNIAATAKLQDTYLQVSGMFDVHEPLVKYEMYDPNTLVGNDKVNTLTLGYGYYIDKTTKVLVNYNLVNEETTPVNNNTLLVEFQTQI